MTGIVRPVRGSRTHDPGHRRRLRRSGIRNRLREDHSGARFQRLRGWTAPQTSADQRDDPRREMGENAPNAYQGMDRFEARKRIVADLKSQNLLASEKPYRLRVPRSGRTGVIVEPMLTDQWFIKMDGLAERGLVAVAKGDVKFFPEHW